MGKSYAVMLAWPETKCKQAGAWYDPIMRRVGFNREGYYQVGHAAVVLINGENGKCSYYDFGRYHAPKGHGRVRSEFTDHDLKLVCEIQFDDAGTPTNLQYLLDELQQKKACHGDGNLHAGIAEIDFDKAHSKAGLMQQRTFIPYGPFVRTGTNCSRFVQQVTLAGIRPGIQKIGLTFPLMLTPTPKWNTRIGRSRLKKIITVNEHQVYEIA